MATFIAAFCSCQWFAVRFFTICRKSTITQLKHTIYRGTTVLKTLFARALGNNIGPIGRCLDRRRRPTDGKQEGFRWHSATEVAVLGESSFPQILVLSAKPGTFLRKADSSLIT